MRNDDPFRAPASEVRDLAGGGELAGRGRRLGASIIDNLLLLVVLIPAMWFGGYLDTSTQAALHGEEVGLGTTLLWSAIGFALFILMQAQPLHDSGQTWGKKLLDIRVVDLDGNKPPFLRLIALRYVPIQVLMSIPAVGPLIYLTNVLLIFRGDRRCGHDLIAGTRVVDCA